MKAAKKKFAFTAALWLLPFLLLAACEGFFRLIHYGGDLDLFVLQTNGNVKEYVLNPNFTRRYFFQKGIKTPVPLSQRFSAVKDASTLRIFCLGESTTQGFPYPPNGAYPFLLQSMLADYFPTKKIEVLNCGITGITSYCIADMEQEILTQYQPDALIIYTGHNEFYGVFGRASTFSPTQNPALTRLFLKLQNSRLFLFLRDVINTSLGRSVRRPAERSAHTLMSLMAGDAEIPYDSPTMLQTTRQFQNNLERICRQAQKKDIPIILCTLVDNLRDLPPFGAKTRRNLSRNDSLQLADFLKAGERFQQNAQFSQAAQCYYQALQIDSSAAQTHYSLAQCLFALGDYEQAKRHFIAAKDYDAVRFRAPSAFNQIIREVASRNHAFTADCAAAFSRRSPGGIPGAELLLEHVHPNLHGHFLLAETIAETVVSHEILGSFTGTRPAKSEDAYLSQCGLTVLDQEIIGYSLFRLTSQWPFPQKSTQSYQRVGNSRTEALARQLIDEGKSNWVELHLVYGSELAEEKQFEQAEAEFLAALTMYPTAVAYDCLGRLYLRLTESAYRDAKDYRRAEIYFRNGVAVYTEALRRYPDDLEMNMNLGLLYLMRADYANAAEMQLRKVIQLAPQHLNARKLLIELLLRRKKLDQAEIAAREALELFPLEGRFYTNLALIEVQKNDVPSAVAHLEQAVRLGDAEKAKLLLQSIRQGRHRDTTLP